MAGYSSTPLPKKLGIQLGHRVLFLSAPAGFVEGLGPLGIIATSRAADDAAGVLVPQNVIVWFTSSLDALRTAFPTTAAQLHKAGGLWVAWPKRASRVPTDVTEDRVRDVALAAGLVDNKVCAIDEVWSGLRCVYRLRDR